MKPVKFITTFSKNGYQVYGRTWIDTFVKHVKDSQITADIYVDFPLAVNDDRLQILDFDQAIPEHQIWLQSFERDYRRAGSRNGLYNKKMAMRFSYKAFVMQHAINNNRGCYLIWLDGDCVFKENQDFSQFPQNILNDKFIAVQREHNGGDDHCESGFVAFDLDHADREKFNLQFIDSYKIANVITMSQPYDGFLIYRSLSGIDYADLNLGHGRGGIQSDPSETFLHPEINRRFLHNIGLTGKKQYDSFESVSQQDEYFRLIRGERRSASEIQKIRNSLVEKRNRNRGRSL